MSSASAPEPQSTGLMPDVKDMTVAVAKSTISAAYTGDGTITFTTTPGSSDGKAGEVEGTRPGAGKPINTAVTLVVYTPVT